MFEACTDLLAVAQVAAGLAVDPFGLVDPPADAFGPLAVPGQILAEVAVAFGAVVDEASEHVDADLFCPGIFGVGLEHIEQALGEVFASPEGPGAPGLVVDCREDGGHFAAVHADGEGQAPFGAGGWCAGRSVVGWEAPGLLGPDLDAVGDLPVRVLHAVAEVSGGRAAVACGGPGVHGHGVGVVHEEAAGSGEAADVVADFEDERNGPLCLHEAAGAERVAYALVYAILEGDFNIEGKGI